MKVDEFDSIIFDCDGVLIDVTTSYDTTINKTISYVLKEIADITADTPLTNEMLLKFKSTGGFNDEIDITYSGILCYIAARKLKKNGSLKPFVPFETFGNPKTLNCDRDSQGDVYYADMSVSVVRPKCLEEMKNGLLPQKWMGKVIAPIKSEAGFDLDYKWQVPLAEYWIKKNLKK